MSSAPRKINNLRDFLVHLPRLAQYEYNEVVSYIVWKVLNLSSTKDTQVDWDSFVGIFESENWKNGTYTDVLKNGLWKAKFSDSAGKHNLHVGSMCNRLCYPLETVYYCFTCTMNPLYEICEYCFDKDKHKGHIYTAKIVVRQEGRVCHCGDTSIFKESHRYNQCKNELNNQQPHDSTARTDYNQDDTSMLSTFNSILDYLIDITIYLKEQNESALLAESLVNSVRKHDLAAVSKTVLADSKSFIPDENALEAKLAIQIDEEDSNIHYMDLTEKLARILNKPAEYAISMTRMLEKGHPSVTVVKSSDLDKIQKISMRLQQEGVTNHVRSMSDTFKRDLSDDLIHWLYISCTEAPSDLTKKKALRLSMLDAWESGLLSTKLTTDFLSPYVAKLNLLGGFLVSYEQRDSFPWFKPWNFGILDDTRVTDKMSSYDKRLADTNIINTVSRFHALHGSRFQYILVESTNNLSRLSRYRMLKVLSSLYTLTDPARQCLAAQYFDIYLAVLYSTVASDIVGFKVSLMSIFSQYTFQHPDTANIAIKSGFIQRTLKYAFTLMSFTSEDLLAYLPIPLYHACKLPHKTIRNRRTIMCFKDICILMSTNTVPLELLENDDILTAIVESFSEFNDILPLKRETTEHVEFENFDFSSYYFYFSSMLIMTDGFIRSISLINEKESRKRIVTKLIDLSMKRELELLAQFRANVSSPFLSRGLLICQARQPSFKMMKQKICNYTAEIINFQVGVDTQNFFHPMSYLFKFVLQWSKCGRYDPLPDYMVNYVDFKDLFRNSKDALYMCESALSTLVLLGQVNVGFWVRNGTPITHQARMYTKYSMRELTYMSDLFNVQFSMSYADPNEFMVTYLTRWGLKNWANGVPMGDYPQHETTVAMVNECLLLLVQSLTEIKSLIIVSSVDGFEKTLKTEIVHALCFKSCSYSQIMDAIPEHITKHAAFDLHLEEYTNFTPPSGLTDCGMYSLKTKYRREIDPYYIGLSPSKRYEAEKNIRTSMASNKHVHYDDTFVPAKRVVDFLKATPYSNLYRISSVETFGLFLKNTLDHINKFNYESLLPIVIHLIHQCVVNNLNDFMKMFWHEFATADTEFYYYNSIGSILYGILLKENFIQVHGKIREIFRYLVQTAPHVDVKSYLEEQTDSFNPSILWSSNEMKATKDVQFERKKKLAKLRKEKMLRELAKQQLQFIKNNGLTSDEEQESLIESSEVIKKQGWVYPEETCVFCKMSHEEEAFIYFSYQEDNICNHGVDFSDKKRVIDLFGGGGKCTSCQDEKIKNFEIECRLSHTSQGAVLRTCGHGAHISCLGNHMKSIRAAHNQTTKNVPVAYGFGLMYCPLCNGLCNSFLPRLVRANYRSVNDFFDDKSAHNTEAENISALLLSPSIKAARIFEDLDKTKKDNNRIEALNKLLVNTVCNIELTMRTQTKPFVQEISNQRLLTIRLLNELILFLHRNEDHSSISPNITTSWERFLKEDMDTDLLMIGNQILQFSCCNNKTGFANNLPGTLRMKELLKRYVFQELLVLAKDLMKVQFYRNCPEIQALIQHQSFISDASNTSELEYSTKLFTAVLQLINPMAETFANEIFRLRYRIYYLLSQSLRIFLKRLSILVYAQYAIGETPKTAAVPQNDVNYYLAYLRLPTLGAVLHELNEEQSIHHLQTAIKSFQPSSLRSLTQKLEGMHFTSPFPVELVTLPHSLSHFFASEEDNLMHRVLKDDIAICLFCGKKCKVQRSVGLHGYAQGVCTNHVRNECKISSTYGVFLMIRSNAVYLSYGERGTFYSAPYLHKHGEPDEDFKYNTPVFLDKKRYEYLCNGIILDNMIPHLVLRLTDGNSDLGGWETM